jgi:hypothetical protein
MMDISNLMLSAQEYSKLYHKTFLVYRKFSSKWKFSAMSISLENVFVFRDRKVLILEFYSIENKVQIST